MYEAYKTLNPHQPKKVILRSGRVIRNQALGADVMAAFLFGATLVVGAIVWMVLS